MKDQTSVPVAGSFYLNYVGCKAISELPLATETQPFYLNYVGCKALLISLIFLQVLRFTLTMWDVKPI